MCICCGDCCGVLTSAKQYPNPAEFYNSNFYAKVNSELCNGCETCLRRCQMDAITMLDKKAIINLGRCIGCIIKLRFRKKNQLGGKKNMEINTEEIIKFVKLEGIEIIGVAPIKPLITDSRYEKNINQICPNAKRVIVFGNVFPQSILDACPENPRPARYTLEALYSEGAEICLKISRLLEKNGCRGVIIPAYLPVEMSYETLGLKGEINLKNAAVEAGLGSRGKNDLLITPDYGPRVRLFGVITDADLEPTPKDDKNYCLNCDLCIKSCPSGALSESGCNPSICAPFAMKWGLPSILLYISELEKEKSVRKVYKKLRGMEMWNFWQALSTGAYYECFMCIQSCPVGRIKFH